MRKTTAVAAITALVLLPLTAVVSTAGPASAGPKGSAIFNTPRPFAKTDKRNFAIVNRVDRAIKGVPRHKRSSKKPQPTIHLTTFLLDHTRSVTDLIAACKRGVAVRVLLDEDIQNANSRRLISALNGDNVKDRNHDGKPDRKPKRGPCNRPKKRNNKTTAGPDAAVPGVPGASDRIARTDPRFAPGNVLLSRQMTARSVDARLGSRVTWGKDGSYVKRCKPSCRSGQGNMHMKIYLFSKTGKSRNVVMVSSSNINRGGAKLGWNDMYIMRNRPKSFGRYVGQHRAMTFGKKAPRSGVQVADGPYLSRFFPIKNAGVKRDPVMKDLRKIKCKSGFGPTRIHISMFYWKGRRGNYIATKLLNLARAGCRVNIIYGAPSRQMASRLRAAAGKNLIELYDSRWDFNEDGWNEVRTHSKFVLVRGNYENKRKKWVVMTGSPNWVAGSLSKGDESTLNIELKGAYDAYLNNWVKIRKNSRKLPYN
jgi:hypothetical protein